MISFFAGDTGGIYYPDPLWTEKVRAQPANWAAWECPRCRKIHAPWIASCDCPPPTHSATTNNTGEADLGYAGGRP